ncbi:hypothetical protein OJAV_G00063530 [Oryzias javanicus]|uniref:Transcription factor HES-5 n=1 Tax=Oryzias javanicus TaxID=123683 RepID=A0A3S2PA93_ORYJA|nr:hypothetical protein OJAV_G00063530 [Oryzias javanicus]
MAPCPTGYPSLHHMRMSEKDHIKLRKPLVEKMRRDRINTCIEQLKVILEKEFHKQEPNSKLEKADILEMTVSFLRHQLQSGQHLRDYSPGSSLCWKDAFSSAAVAPLQGLQQQEQTLHQAQKDPSSSSLCSILQDSSRGSVWRPW